MNGRDLAQGISERLQNVHGKTLSPNLIYAQLAHETGNFTSELATKYHNYGGLTQTTPNDLAQPDGSNYYMSFQTDEDFVNYMADYLNKYDEDGLFNARDSRTYAEALKRGGYFGDTIENYVAGMQNFLGSSPVADFAMVANNSVNPLDPVVEQEDTPEASFEDKFLDSVYDSFLWGTFRTQAAKKDLQDDESFRLTQEDIDHVQKELDGDYTATLWACQNAHSQAQLNRLVQMKKEDLERRKRIDASNIDLNTTGTIIGTLLDPLNYVPILGSAGKVGNVLRYAKLAAGTAAANIVERAAAQKASGYHQDFIMASLIGGAAGGLIPLSLDMMGKGFSKTGAKLYGKSIDVKINADKIARGKLLSSSIISDDTFIKTARAMNDMDFIRTIKDVELAKHIDPEKGVYVISLEDAKRLGNMRGQDVPDTARAFFDDVTGTSVLIKDNINETDDIWKLILHEKGSHGLKNILSEVDYKRIMDEVSSRVKNTPSPAFEKALKKAYNKNDPEEILGYLAEELKPSNPLMRSLKKKVNEGLRKLGIKTDMSDDEFYDLLKNSAEKNMEKNNSFRVLNNGEVVYNGLHFSEQSLLNPEKLNDAAEVNGFRKRLKDWVKRSKLFATPYTVITSSVSPTLKQFAKRILHNPYMDEVVEHIPLEQHKAYIIQQANRYHNDYHRLRDKALVEKVGISGRFSATGKRDFDRAVIECYNATYGNNIAGHIGEQFEPIVVEAAKKLKELRSFIIDTMKNTEQIFGEGNNLLPKEWRNIDDEFWRFIDDDARASFVSRFDDIKAAINYLTEYGKKAAKRDVIKKRLEEEAIEKWKIAIKLTKEGQKGIPSKPLPLSDEEVDNAIEKLARSWATGIVDQNVTNREISVRDITSGLESLHFMRHHFPMDTSFIDKDPWGISFSFDNDIRSFDYDSTVPFLLNRFAGETSLGILISGKNVQTVNRLGIMENLTDDIKNIRKTIESELETAANARRISKSQVADELKTFDYMMNKLRGISIDDEPKTRWDALAKSLTTLSYARNSAYMGINQLSEISGTLAYEGFNAIYDLIPSVGRLVDDIRLGRGSADVLQDALMDTFGEDSYRYIWHNTDATSSNIYRRVGTGNGFDKTMDKIHGWVNAGASFMSTINMLPKLTDVMIRSARKQMLIDTVKWVNNLSDLPFYRNPFSEKKLQAAGITNADVFRGSLKEYLHMDTHGNLTGLDMKKLHKDNPLLFMKLRTLIDNQAMRCITTSTIANSNMHKESSAFWKIFFQFKDFTMRATHSQSLRAWQNKEIEDILATAFSVVTTAPVIVGLAYARAWAKYGDNKTKRQQYLDKYTSPGKLLYGSFMRGAITGSPFSTINDIAETAGLSALPTVRTTVSRYSQPNIFENPEGVVGSVITQLPAVKTGLDIIGAGYDLAMATRETDRYTEQEFNRALSLLPGQNMFAFVKLRKELANELHLSKREQ